jgi:hypothetical protein
MAPPSWDSGPPPEPPAAGGPIASGGWFPLIGSPRGRRSRSETASGRPYDAGGQKSFRATTTRTRRACPRCRVRGGGRNPGTRR